MMIRCPIPRQKMIAAHIHNDAGKAAPGRAEAVAARSHGRMGVRKRIYFAVEKNGGLQFGGVLGELTSFDKVNEKMADERIIIKLGQVKMGKVVQLRDRSTL